VASRTAAIFVAASALSTTSGDTQDSLGAPGLDGLPVEVDETRPSLPGDHRGVVAFDEEVPVAEDAVCERRRRFIEEHEIDAPSEGGLQPSGQAAEGAHVA